MDVENELRKRFAAAINKFVQPRILFGPKWVRPLSGEPGRYQFVGAQKVAKATGIPVAKVAQKILDLLKLEGLGLEARLTPSGTITLSPEGTGGQPGRPKQESGEKPKKKS